MEITKAKVVSVIKKVIIAFFGLLAVALVQDYFKYQKSKPPSEKKVFQVLTQVSSEINKSTPMMVDKITRLDNVLALSNRKIQYNYTITSILKKEIDTSAFIKEMRPLIVNNASTNPEMESFRELDVTMIYCYRDKEFKHFCSIVVEPKDYKND
jgi:hypothetical protein